MKREAECGVQWYMERNQISDTILHGEKPNEWYTDTWRETKLDIRWYMRKEMNYKMIYGEKPNQWHTDTGESKWVIKWYMKRNQKIDKMIHGVKPNQKMSDRMIRGEKP